MELIAESRDIQDMREQGVKAWLAPIAACRWSKRATASLFTCALRKWRQHFKREFFHGDSSSVLALAIIAAKVIVGAHYLNTVDNPVAPFMLQFLEPIDVLSTWFCYAFLNLLTIKLGGSIDGQWIAIAPDDRLSAFATFAIPLCEWFVARWAFHRSSIEPLSGMRRRADETAKQTPKRESKLIERVSNMAERDVGDNGGSKRKKNLGGILTRVSCDN